MRITLIAEGTSDEALVPIIVWAVQQAGVTADLEVRRADLRGLPNKPSSLGEKVSIAYELFPCEIIVVHRDADSAGRQTRLEEIERAVGPLLLTVPYVGLIPVKMTEAWLLFDEAALRNAAGNPHSKCQLSVPKTSNIENVADPKHLLFEQLRIASELTGRRLAKFDRSRARSQVAEYIDDFSPLRTLDAFRSFEEDLKAALSLLTV
jgi:hypothetical protein